MADVKAATQKRAVILTADKVEDLEVIFPYFRLLEAGFEVDLAAPKKGPIGGEYGYQLEPGKTFDEIDPAKYDLLLLPGGTPDGAPTTVRRNPRAQAIAR
jgi:protease I